MPSRSNCIDCVRKPMLAEASESDSARLNAVPAFSAPSVMPDTMDDNASGLGSAQIEVPFASVRIKASRCLASTETILFFSPSVNYLVYILEEAPQPCSKAAVIRPVMNLMCFEVI